MKKKITFKMLLWSWCLIAFVLRFINAFTIQVPILDNIIMAGFGVNLLIYPVYPANMDKKFTEKQCRIFMRIIAVVEIIIAFAVKTTY